MTDPSPDSWGAPRAKPKRSCSLRLVAAVVALALAGLAVGWVRRRWWRRCVAVGAVSVGLLMVEFGRTTTMTLVAGLVAGLAVWRQAAPVTFARAGRPRRFARWRFHCGLRSDPRRFRPLVGQAVDDGQ